jgi:zinc-ribbon domain
MALMWLVACALVIPIPLVSTIVFGLAGLIGFGAGASSKFTDLTIWGVASLILAAFSFFGWIGKRKTARREREAREQMAAHAAQLQLATHAALLAAQTSAAGAAPPQPSPTELPSGSERCVACGAQNPPGSRFCAACGSAIMPTAGGFAAPA